MLNFVKFSFVLPKPYKSFSIEFFLFVCFPDLLRTENIKIVDLFVITGPDCLLKAIGISLAATLLYSILSQLYTLPNQGRGL